MPAVTGDTEVSPDHTLDDGGEHDGLSHYVRKDDLVGAMVEGVPVTALCGKRWVPSRDPLRYPVCPVCESLAPYEEEFSS